MTGKPHPDWDRAGRDWPNRSASRFVDRGAVRWHVQIAGSGPRLLLLHGTGAATHSWRGLLPLLAESHEVVAPDLPGHGFTRVASRRDLSLPAMARAVQDLIAETGAPDVIIGHSAGAAIALQMVLHQEARPRLIIGLNPALTPFRGIAGMVFPPLARMLALNPVVPWVFSGMASATGQAARILDSTGSRIDAEGARLYARMIARPDHVDGALAMMALWELEPLLADLPGLAVPVHLMVGEGDSTVPPAEALRLAEAHDGIEAVRIPALGHLMHEEDPALFARRIADQVEAVF